MFQFRIYMNFEMFNFSEKITVHALPFILCYEFNLVNVDLWPDLF
jgi:hypothetical protein